MVCTRGTHDRPFRFLGALQLSSSLPLGALLAVGHAQITLDGGNLRLRAPRPHQRSTGTLLIEAEKILPRLQGQPPQGEWSAALPQACAQ
jgi:hypothetical protein